MTEPQTTPFDTRPDTTVLAQARQAANDHPTWFWARIMHDVCDRLEGQLERAEDLTNS